jgi:hypothetical protein
MLTCHTGLGKGPSQSDMASVANVITTTRDLLKKEDSLVWVMSAMAQRVSADTKIKASIEYVSAHFLLLCTSFSLFIESGCGVRLSLPHHGSPLVHHSSRILVWARCGCQFFGHEA